MRPTACVAPQQQEEEVVEAVAAPFCTDGLEDGGMYGVECVDPLLFSLLAFGVGKKNPRLVVVCLEAIFYTHTLTH